ncbi:M28 family peptidase [candidate division KSB1 bacterium]
MKKKVLLFTAFVLCVFAVRIGAQEISSPALKTPLDQRILTMLTNEISGQMTFNNEVMLAGAPWLRDRSEFSSTFYESQKIYDIARSYGIETTSLVRYPGDGTFEYPFEGELRLLEPQERLIARLGADAALVARSSRTTDVTGELVYIPNLTREEIDAMIAAGPQERYRGKIALMWSHAQGDAAQALDAAGIRGVISFSSRDRYLDPNQVVYPRGSYGDGENLTFGFSVSWRQWSELLEDVESGRRPVLRCRTVVEYFPNRFETVFSWIPGTEPDAKGVVFTAHLFEGYTKRGANDNMSGCVIQLETLRALTKLIKEGSLPQPRRTIYFIWPNEISGTYEFIKQTPGFVDKLSVNINMDMVGEGLRINNSHFTMSECPDHLPSYLDGLAKSVMNYVWRTNDIVYLPDAPRGRPGGQYFPIPMVEKNGSTDAFRFFIHRATGGSDHICFNNPAVAIPGIEFFTWPDQWYHADTDTPDKSDPTQMRRVAFIGAACAWAAANCTDDVLAGLLDATSEFGYERIAEREHPASLTMVENSTAQTLQQETSRALNLISFALDREIGALKSIEDIYSGSSRARIMLSNRVEQWELYRNSLMQQVLGYAELRANQLNARRPVIPEPTSNERRYANDIPSVHPDVKGKDFYLERSDVYQQQLRAQPQFLRDLGLTSRQASSIRNFVNGKNSITTIKHYVSASTGGDIALDSVAGYIDFLRSIGWVEE